jgi:hypothetical protein
MHFDITDTETESGTARAAGDAAEEQSRVRERFLDGIGALKSNLPEPKPNVSNEQFTLDLSDPIPDSLPKDVIDSAVERLGKEARMQFEKDAAEAKKAQLELPAIELPAIEVPAAKTPSVDLRPVPTNDEIVRNLKDWFNTNIEQLDENKNGNLDADETKAALASRNGSAYDQAFLAMLDSAHGFFDSTDFHIGPQRLTPTGVNRFDGWVKAFDRDMDRLETMAPEDHRAVKALLDNFNLIDTNDNESITHDELREALARPEIDSQMREDLITASGKFNEIAEGTRILRSARAVEQILGIERPIGTFELAKHIVSHTRENFFEEFTNGIGEALEVSNYAAIQSVALDGYTYIDMYGDAPEK